MYTVEIDYVPKAISINLLMILLMMIMCQVLISNQTSILECIAIFILIIIMLKYKEMQNSNVSIWHDVQHLHNPICDFF